MSPADVTAVGVSCKAYEGSMCQTMPQELGRDPLDTLTTAVRQIFMDQQRELTSPFPLVGEVAKGQSFSVADVAEKFGFSPVAGTGISGPDAQSR